MGSKWEDYFTFAFVRHPMDWQVSLYEYIKNTPHRDHEVAKQISFKEFALRQIDQKAKCQVDFISEKGKIIVDYVGKLETIREDLDYLLKKVGIEHKAVPHMNRSPRVGNYMSYYDNELELAVRKYYRKDFELFGYK